MRGKPGKQYIRERIAESLSDYADRHAQREAKRQAHNERTRENSRRSRLAPVVEIPKYSPLYQKQLRRQEAA